jgi:SAM-dependent methyltransferase
MARSPFIARLQTWPRGYPGDFETVEYLIESANRAERQTVAYWIESYCLNTAVAQQHRNKVRWQAEQIEAAIDNGVRAGKPANILIIACGSSPDLKLCLPAITDKPFQVVLNDSDRGALELSSERLISLGERVTTVHGNVIRKINALASHGPYDLVLAGGLFDYLKDQHATFLIEAMLTKLLGPNGRIAFTNIARPNPYKYWMEYCTDWFLIERTEEDLRALINRTEADFSSVSITQDLTDLVYKVEIAS